MERNKPSFRYDLLNQRLALRAAELERWNELSERTFRNVLWEMGPSHRLALDFIESGRCLDHREDFEAYLSKISLMKEFLYSDDLRQMIRDGETTLAIVKPQANDVYENSKDFPHGVHDIGATEFFLEKIKERAGSFSRLYHISTILSSEQADLFYDNIKPRLREKFPDTWREIHERNVQYFSEHPSTFVIVYRPVTGNIDTIDWWRNEIGPTDPEDARRKRATRHTLRAMYGRDNSLPNNLVHGSDSLQSLYDEIAMLSEFLGDWHDLIQGGLIEDEEIR